MISGVLVSDNVWNVTMQYKALFQCLSVTTAAQIVKRPVQCFFNTVLGLIKSVNPFQLCSD